MLSNARTEVTQAASAFIAGKVWVPVVGLPTAHSML